MAIKSLAIKYRPTTFDDVVEQGAIKQILQEQLNTGTTKNAYLFCGGAGTGKTTTARIFANEINKHEGNPIEMDAASNNSVDDVRAIIQQAQTKSLDSEFKVFIIDECHMITTAGWNAMLKLIEEPPAKSIFLFCTTDPQKIPKTILSRVQRYDFQRISQDGIVKRLDYIMLEEYGSSDNAKDINAMEYIAKVAEGGMRDAITMLDKCLSYSEDLTIWNVVKALGVADYDIMFELVNSVLDHRTENTLTVIDTVHKSGADLKQFIKTFTTMVLDICKYGVTGNFDVIQIPNTYADTLDGYSDCEYDICHKLLATLIELNSEIKWETSPKSVIEAKLFVFLEA